MLAKWRGIHQPLPTTKPPEHTPLTLLALALFALYAHTAQQSAAAGDAAAFAASCLHAGIAHAPGYPLYALLCAPFSFLPLAPPLAAALFSAVCAAAAVWCLGRVVYLLTADAVLALGAAALFGVSQSFWGQATLPAAAALHMLLFFAAWWALLHWHARPQPRRLALALALASLALASHWLFFALGAAAFLPPLWQQRRALAQHLRQPRALLLCGGALLLGLVPLAFLLWRSHYPAAFSHLPPAAAMDFAAFWQVISHGFASPAALALPPGDGSTDKLAFAIFLTKQVLTQEIGWIGGALALGGAVLQWRQVGAANALALGAAFAVAVLLLLTAAADFAYDGMSAQIFSAYPLLPYAVACIWAALAVRRLLPRWRGTALALLCLLTLTLNFEQNDRRSERLAADIADMHLHAVPDGAFYPMPSLHMLLAYQQQIKAARPQLLILPPPQAALPAAATPGEKPYPPHAGREAIAAAMNAYAAEQPVCTQMPLPFALSGAVRPHLIFSCVQADAAASAAMDEGILIFIRYLINAHDRTRDWQARDMAAQLMENAMQTLMRLRARRLLPAEWGALMEDLSATPAGQLALMEYLAAQPQFEISAARALLFRQAMEINLPELSLRRQARMLSALAQSFAAISPRSEESHAAAAKYHQAAAALLPQAQAPGVQAAWRFYRQEGMEAEAEALEARHGAEALQRGDAAQQGE